MSSLGNITQLLESEGCGMTPSASNITILTLLICALCTGLISNSVLCLSVYLCRSLRTPTNMFVFSLALSDIQICLTMLPFRTMDYLGACIGKYVCAVLIASDVLASSTSIITLLATSMERYTAVEFPYWYNKFVTRRRSIILCVCIWIYGLLWASFSLIDWTDFVDISIAIEQGKCISKNIHFVTLVNAMNVVLPIACISLIYGKLWHTARAQTLEVNTANSRKKTSKCRLNKCTLTVVIVYITFAACWLPNGILITINAIKPDFFPTLVQRHKLLTSILSEIFIVFLPPLNSVLNPFIYGLYSTSFRQAFKDVLRRRRARQLPVPTRARTLQSSLKFDSESKMYEKRSFIRSELQTGLL